MLDDEARNVLLEALLETAADVRADLEDTLAGMMARMRGRVAWRLFSQSWVGPLNSSVDEILVSCRNRVSRAYSDL